VVSAGVVLLFCLLGLPATGLDLTAALKRLWFLPAGALLAAWGTAILAEKTGTVVIDVGPVLMTTGSLSAAAAIFVRALALAIPLIVLASTIDPRDLSDALIQHLRLPEVVVVSVLAAGRLLGLLVSEWQVLAMARRARGMAGGSLARRTRSLFSAVFVLLVVSIRRAATLAMAMEGRAFGRPGRTWRRRSTFAVRDVAAVVSALVVCVLGIVAAHVLGTLNRYIAGRAVGSDGAIGIDRAHLTDEVLEVRSPFLDRCGVGQPGDGEDAQGAVSGLRLGCGFESRPVFAARAPE